MKGAFWPDYGKDGIVMSVTTKKAVPQADGDFYQISSVVSQEDQALLQKTRAFLEAEITPIINHYWTREEFPYHLIPKFAELGIVGLPYQGYGCPSKNTLLDGILALEFGRVDCSIATLFGVYSGRAMCYI